MTGHRGAAPRAAGADLRGRSVLLTGASSGLGAHLAGVLAATGARLFLAARRTDRLERVAAGLRAAGHDATALALDVSVPESVASCLRAVDEAADGVDVLVNNAGTGRLAPALEHTRADWEQALAVNLTGPWHLSQAVAAALVERGRGGVILNVASVAGLDPTPGATAYSTSKAALVHLTRQLALEWGPLGIRVNCICPGPFLTELTAGHLADEGARARVVRRLPLRRLGEATDLDAVVTLLVSGGSGYITGAVVPVDGGASLL